jgi:hypothetical protein
MDEKRNHEKNIKINLIKPNFYKCCVEDIALTIEEILDLLDYFHTIKQSEVMKRNAY